MNSLALQLFGIAKGLKEGNFNIPDIGEILPASFMIHELEHMMPMRCAYMNKWGCDKLGTHVDEINEIGPRYYEKYFVKTESEVITQGMQQYLLHGDFEQQYNFFQQVRLHNQRNFTWFYTVCKLLKVKNEQQETTDRLVLLSSPVMGMDTLISKVNKTLDQNKYISAHYREFAQLTKREKEIIVLIAQGKSSQEIADQLFISALTVSTHRKNIIRKLDCKSSTELVRFALAFDML